MPFVSQNMRKEKKKLLVPVITSTVWGEANPIIGLVQRVKVSLVFPIPS